MNLAPCNSHSKLQISSSLTFSVPIVTRGASRNVSFHQGSPDNFASNPAWRICVSVPSELCFWRFSKNAKSCIAHRKKNMSFCQIAFRETNNRVLAIDLASKFSVHSRLDWRFRAYKRKRFQARTILKNDFVNSAIQLSIAHDEKETVVVNFKWEGERR